MDLSRTVTEINGDFHRKEHIFPPTPCILRPRWRGPLGIKYRRWGSKTRMMGLLGRIKSLTISSAVWIQYTNVTGRRTDTGRQQRPRLRIASRGKRKSDCGEMVHAWTVDHWSLVAYNWRVSGRGIEVSFSERSVVYCWWRWVVLRSGYSVPSASGRPSHYSCRCVRLIAINHVSRFHVIHVGVGQSQ